MLYNNGMLNVDNNGMFESSMVNELSMVEPLRFYCIAFFLFFFFFFFFFLFCHCMFL